jgi:hypothetical protein
VAALDGALFCTTCRRLAPPDRLCGHKLKVSLSDSGGRARARRAVQGVFMVGTKVARPLALGSIGGMVVTTGLYLAGVAALATGGAAVGLAVAAVTFGILSSERRNVRGVIGSPTKLLGSAPRLGIVKEIVKPAISPSGRECAGYRVDLISSTAGGNQVVGYWAVTGELVIAMVDETEVYLAPGHVVVEPPAGVDCDPARVADLVESIEPSHVDGRVLVHDKMREGYIDVGTEVAVKGNLVPTPRSGGDAYRGVQTVFTPADTAILVVTKNA